MPWSCSHDQALCTYVHLVFGYLKSLPKRCRFQCMVMGKLKRRENAYKFTPASHNPYVHSYNPRNLTSPILISHSISPCPSPHSSIPMAPKCQRTSAKASTSGTAPVRDPDELGRPTIQRWRPQPRLRRSEGGILLRPTEHASHLAALGRVSDYFRNFSFHF